MIDSYESDDSNGMSLEESNQDLTEDEDSESGDDVSYVDSNENLDEQQSGDYNLYDSAYSDTDGR